ncbi:MAG: protoporphyrinogen oxidase [Candidatus Hydrogenedentota bacterium]|nr:MAG: protoporphyrinogen oxidase [Candidatus Hydrogenedentota bacterium]
MQTERFLLTLKTESQAVITIKAHKKVIVLGAGISGLCTANRLCESYASDEVLVLDGAEKAGGYIQSERVDGYLCDRGPNGFLSKEPLTLEWIEELGLSGELVRANEASAHRFLLLEDGLVEIQPPPAFLFSPILSVKGKLRLALEPFISRKTDDAPESVWNFASRRIGSEAADTLVSAMVLGVFGGDAHGLSLAHCFPRMAEMESKHGGLFKAMLAKKKEAKASGTSAGGPMGPGGALTTFKEGMGRLTCVAAEKIADSIELNAQVERVTYDQEHFVVTCADGTSYTADSLVSALPAYAVGDIAWELEGSIHDAAGKVECSPLVVVCTAFDKKDKHYDAKSDPGNPRWYLVDVKYVKKFKRTVSLAELKQCEVLEDMQLVRKGNRLSVMPVTEQQWEFINGML